MMLTDLPPHATERLWIRPLAPADAEALRVLTNDPAITAIIHFLPSPFGLADAEALIASSDGGQDCFVGAWQHDSDALIGVIGTHLRGAHQLEIGYWIGSRFHRHGYATEAAASVIAHLRQMYPDRQIIAQCRSDNQASLRVLHKLGLRIIDSPEQHPERHLLALPV